MVRARLSPQPTLTLTLTLSQVSEAKRRYELGSLRSDPAVSAVTGFAAVSAGIAGDGDDGGEAAGHGGGGGGGGGKRGGGGVHLPRLPPTVRHAKREGQGV